MGLADNANAIAVVLRLRDETEDGISSAEKRVAKLGQRLQKAGAIATAALSAPLAVMGKSAIDAASDTEESLNKVNVVFGESASVIRDFSAGAAKNLGLSRQSALDAAGTFGNLFTTMGLGQKPAADMSTSLLTLAADLGSFNNLDPTEVLEKLRSGLVGQSEPLRALGVNLTEATVQAKAMELGLADANGELSEAAKVQARYALILEQTKTAQGDFARTSDGLANSTRTAKATFADLSAELGKELLPIAIEVVSGLKGLLSGFSTLSPEIKTAIVVIGGIAFAFGPVVTVIGTVLTLLPLLGTALTVLTGPIGLIVAGVALLALAWVNNWGDIQGKTKAVFDVLGPIFSTIGDALGLLWQGAQAMAPLFIAAFESLKGPISGAIQFLLAPIHTLIGAVRGALDLLGKLKDVAGGVLGAAGGVLSGAGNLLGGFRLPDFHQGGIVPGPIGAPQVIVAHGGEEIRTPAQQAATSGGVVVTGNTFVIREEGDIRRVAQELHELGRLESRRRGLSAEPMPT